MRRWICVLLLGFLPVLLHAQQASPTMPSVLILRGDRYQPLRAGDFTFLRELHQQGFAIEMVYSKETPITWEYLKRFNCLVLLNLPLPEEAPGGWNLWKGPPHRKEFLEMLNRYLADGGGVLVLLDTYTTNISPAYENYNYYLGLWSAKLPLEGLHDPATETNHPRNLQPFIYTTNITPSPVSQGVRGIWFPITARSGNHNFQTMGQPIEVSKDWIEVVKGSDTSYAEALKPGFALRANEHFTPYVRKGRTPSPTLYAVREYGGGRLGLAAVMNIYHFVGGTSWIHDRVMLGKGMNTKPSDFNVLLQNTLRWLTEPSMQNGKLGEYVQNPKQLLHPNKRLKPADYHEEFETYQNYTPPAPVRRGLVGARTAYSGGKGTVEQYAAAARRVKLDFIVFLEQLGKISEADYRKLEADCKRLSTETLKLIPGLRFTNNIGNPMFAYGENLTWPKPSQLDGPNKDQLRTQCFDKDGRLYYNDEDAKNWIWTFVGSNRNIGYYDFSNNPGVPIRNLRLFGILGFISYRNGKLIEDRTADYLDYVTDGDPPLACAVDLVESPTEMDAAVRMGHYLTHVAVEKLADLTYAMRYGHQYGRANVYPSTGPQIKAWAETRRVMTFAGESFVPSRAVMRPQLWLTSDVGLKEVIIYSERKPFRRFLPNGAKEFKEQFEWAYDRHRVLTVEATDMKGNRAVSAALEIWADANSNSWCGDRQNGELWHGAATFPGPRRPEFDTGPTWDGGPVAYIGMEEDVHPGIAVREGNTRRIDGFLMGYGGRWSEGNMFPTCFDESVANVAIIAEHEYLPGVVANAYHTLGPVTPMKYLRWTQRRTQFLQRIADVADSNALYPQRAGGNLGLVEGEMALKQDALIDVAGALRVRAYGFAADSSNIPLWAVRTDESTPVALGTAESYGAGPSQGVRLVQRGGYLALLPNEKGNIGIIFNVGTEPVKLTPPPQGMSWRFAPARAEGARKAGETFDWHLLVLHDALDEKELNLARIERLRRYLGLTGENGCGIAVKRGKLVSQFGIIDLAPQDGIVEFTVPNPGWKVNVPLGMRFTGFNPNWTIGQFQRAGHSPGFYTDGKNVYRNLATDDRDMVHLAVYPDRVPTTHMVVGHPVQCDAPQLIIEVTMLNDAPHAYRVAVNNPTDKPITTVLKKAMDLPGFDFPDSPVSIPAGGYLVIRAK
ncbi:MAG: hypothetical protein ACYC7E_02530 [Armatimonadota bacterium]